MVGVYLEFAQIDFSHDFILSIKLMLQKVRYDKALLDVINYHNKNISKIIEYI